MCTKSTIERAELRETATRLLPYFPKKGAKAMTMRAIAQAFESAGGEFLTYYRFHLAVKWLKNKKVVMEVVKPKERSALPYLYFQQTGRKL